MKCDRLSGRDSKSSEQEQLADELEANKVIVGSKSSSGFELQV